MTKVSILYDVSFNFADIRCGNSTIATLPNGALALPNGTVKTLNFNWLYAII